MKLVLKDVVQTRLPTDYGEFVLHYYHNNQDEKEHIALVKGDVSKQENVLVRLHSECFTGDVLGSRRCDCGEQLAKAMNAINQAGCGAILYLRQEGRGIGLLHKLKAYNLQDTGLDTVEANLALGHLPDERHYDIAAEMLRQLGIRSVALMTNNPTKIEALNNLGILVTKRVSIITQANLDNAAYLQTKAKKMAHLFE